MRLLSKIFKASGIQMEEQSVTIEVPRFTGDAYTARGKTPEERKAQEALDILSRARGEHVRILDQAESEAARLIHKASIAVEDMNREAEAERKRLYDELFDTARQEGYDEGFNTGKAKADLLIAEAERFRAETLAERERTYAAIEPDMVELILGITRKLLGDAADMHPQVVTNLIRQGLAEATLTGSLTLRVSKDDYEAVTADKEQLVAIAEGAHIEIVRDISLTRGDCIIETNYGNIDCSLERQYESFARNMRYIMNAAKPETDDDSIE